jgi:hypothetical protein
MKPLLRMAATGAGAAALVVSSLLVTGSAAEAAGDGTLVVNIVDQDGRPTTGLAQVFSATDGAVFPDEAPVPSSRQTIAAPAGGYGLLTITPWSGFTCEGIAPCGLGSPPTVVTPAVTVIDGSTTLVTARVTVPSIVGGTAIGSALSIQFPPKFAELQALLDGVQGGPILPQWVRGTTDIPGATGTSYSTVRDDGAQALSARLLPSLGMTNLFAGAALRVEPLSTNAITVARFVKTKTRTKAAIAKRIGVGERATVRVKVKAKGTADVPDGFVVLSIGKFKARKVLKKGIAFINLPALRRGTYTIVVKYTGSDDLKKSKAKRTTIRVG